MYDDDDDVDEFTVSRDGVGRFTRPAVEKRGSWEGSVHWTEFVRFIESRAHNGRYSNSGNRGAGGGGSGVGNALIYSVNQTRIKIMIMINMFIIYARLIHRVLRARYDVVVTIFQTEKNNKNQYSYKFLPNHQLKIWTLEMFKTPSSRVNILFLYFGCTNVDSSILFF